MFSYYGSKSIIVDLYPKPLYDKIIEPFAGSARYSLKYFEKDILLIDKYDVVVKVWKWLQQCSPADILGLPVLTKGLELNSLNLSEGERLFLGIQAGIASPRPRNKVSQFSAEQNGRKNQYKKIADQLYKIKHWKIIQGDYTECENEVATFFIDGPYQYGGQAYVHNKINFNHLSQWVQVLNGQVIVCENMKADWLSFSPLSKMRGANGKHTVEAIFTNYHTHFNNIQQELFRLTPTS